MDPVTPPDVAAEVASHLANSKHVVVPHRGHVVFGINLECLDEMVLKFLEKGSVDGLNASCVEQIAPLPF